MSDIPNTTTDNLQAHKWMLERLIPEAESSEIIPPEDNPQLPGMRKLLDEVLQELRRRSGD